MHSMRDWPRPAGSPPNEEQSMNAASPQRDIVLVVDDSPESLSFLTQALEEAGVTVLVATSGEGALTIAGRITPDIVLLDAMMPKMDGFETCRRLKAQAALQHVPVIFMTGLTETEHVVNALDSGGVDYLTKPIDIDELQARIKVHLANARTVQSAQVALDATGRHLIAVSKSGAVQWSTPQAQKILQGPGGPVGLLNRTALELAAWLQRMSDGSPERNASFSIDLNEGAPLQITYMGMIGPDEYLFRLARDVQTGQDQVLRDHFGITAREAEVLLWIAKGKSNRDIGEILGLSPRTVNKHLEQIYTKLGVENRASAAVKAAQVIFEM